MRGKPKKTPREKDMTSRYLGGGMDEDRIETGERFKARNKTAQQEKTARTAGMRAAEQSGVDIDALPVGEVLQVYSLFSEVEYAGVTFRCVVRRTLTKVSEGYIVVGDRVRLRDTSPRDEAGKIAGQPEGVVEQVLPRQTVLTRADSFKGTTQRPIVANAERMLIVASLRQPRVKWGLVDRMIVAANSGGLQPVVCLNKMDLAAPGAEAPAGSEDDEEPDETPREAGRRVDRANRDEEIRRDDVAEALKVLEYYGTLGVRTLQTSVENAVGLTELRDLLRGRTTVLAGHSGVGKSSLIRAIQPRLDLRVGEVSRYTDKGRHTTTSARRYLLDFGGAVVDTPGVKLFGLWGVTRENLDDYFPDVAASTAPPWRVQSHARIAASLAD